MNEQPWLILTLRRTGGTSLTTFLSSTSKFATVQHEPFNSDRIFGEVSTRAQRARSSEDLENDIADLLVGRPNMKHCFEVVPLAVTQALINVCVREDYRIMFLTREKESSRILSLAMAMSTGAWGPEEAEQIYPQIMSGELEPKTISIDTIRNRINTDYSTLGKVITMLRNRKVDYDWYTFEEIYFGDVPVEELALEIASKHGVVIESDDPRLEAFSQQSGQRSSTIKPFIPGLEKIEALAKNLCLE